MNIALASTLFHFKSSRFSLLPLAPPLHPPHRSAVFRRYRYCIAARYSSALSDFSEGGSERGLLVDRLFLRGMNHEESLYRILSVFSLPSTSPTPHFSLCLTYLPARTDSVHHAGDGGDLGGHHVAHSSDGIVVVLACTCDMGRQVFYKEEARKRVSPQGEEEVGPPSDVKSTEVFATGPGPKEDR